MVTELINQTIIPVVNQSINSTMSSSFTSTLITTYLPNILNRFKELVTVPLDVPEMWWIVSPMLITLILLTFYFGRYRKEELGWNSAVSNSLILVFVSVDLFRFWFTHNNFMETILAGNIPYTLLAPLIVFALGFWLLFFEFFHMLPKHLAFFIGSSLPINVIAYTAIANVYSGLVFDIFTFISAILLFFVVYGITFLIKMKIPEAHFGGRQKDV